MLYTTIRKGQLLLPLCLVPNTTVLKARASLSTRLGHLSRVLLSWLSPMELERDTMVLPAEKRSRLSAGCHPL